MTTKEKIVYESMKLFAMYGFDSVSVRQIAKNVGVGDSALYKHFKSKQAIFDEIVQICKERFNERKDFNIKNTKNWEDLVDVCMNMFAFQKEDEWIVAFRRILILEQFKNPEMSNLYHQFFYDMPIKGTIPIFKELIQQGLLKDRDPVVMSLELYAPFFIYHTWSKDDQDKENAETLLRKHVQNFIDCYRCNE